MHQKVFDKQQHEKSKMTLNFQNRIVFPAPETSYTTQSAFGQVVYLPRNIMKRVEHKFNQSATAAK